MINALGKGWLSRGPADTRRAGRLLAAHLPPDCVLCLNGLPGSGKTTFVKGLAAGWEITREICSPTFNLYFHYQGTRDLLHLDAYRLNAPAEAEDLLLEEFLSSPYCLAIEWPENVPAAWLREAWQLHFSSGPSANTRRLRLLVP